MAAIAKQDQANQVVVDWDPLPTTSKLKLLANNTITAVSDVLKEPTISAATLCYPSIPRPAMAVVVEAGCAKVTDQAKNIAGKSIDSCYANPNGSCAKITRWMQS